MPPRRDRTHQDDVTPPPHPPTPQLMSYERASVDMLAGITRLLERQSERPGKSHEEDVAERWIGLANVEMYVGDPYPPPGEAAEEHTIDSREMINMKNSKQTTTFIGCLSDYLAGTCAWLQPAALEALTNSTRTDSPRRIGRNEFRRLEAAAAQDGVCVERREAASTRFRVDVLCVW
ncbi:hypothetical protein F511_19307 [Dorcoceras hygrometricum]|uniref:Uncharacterized protein n=1 Tax=Dorcoceras hygrometricum TaxID=472368 RepID=A0A2Z7AXH4_9LAMI|nr:hypothetical protein F511_19307 [Dorcoceras hygrometricum]